MQQFVISNWIIIDRMISINVLTHCPLGNFNEISDK